MYNESSIGTAQGVWNYLHANSYSRPRELSGSTATIAAPESITIAISREAGIDAGQIARAIGSQLGWLVWDHELLELIAMRLGSNVSELEELDERHISWLQESLEAFLVLHAVNQHTFVRHLREAMEELAARGNCIIVGRGAPHILPHKSTLKVRLVASREQRIATFRRQLKLSDNTQATRELEKIDRERARFVTDHFHKDPLDPASYDLVLNVSNSSPADCTKIVVHALQSIERLQDVAKKPSAA